MIEVRNIALNICECRSYNENICLKNGNRLKVQH